MKARVTVTLKSGVLDPQGQAIHGALKSLGFPGVASVRQGKLFDIEIADGDVAAAEASLKAMCDKLLANTVIENYAIEMLGAKPAAAPEPVPVAPEPAAIPEPIALAPEPEPVTPGEIPIDARIRPAVPRPDGAI